MQAQTPRELTPEPAINYHDDTKTFKQVRERHGCHADTPCAAGPSPLLLLISRQLLRRDSTSAGPSPPPSPRPRRHARARRHATPRHDLYLSRRYATAAAAAARRCLERSCHRFARDDHTCSSLLGCAHVRCHIPAHAQGRTPATLHELSPEQPSIKYRDIAHGIAQSIKRVRAQWPPWRLCGLHRSRVCACMRARIQACALMCPSPCGRIHERMRTSTHAPCAAAEPPLCW